MFYQFLTFVAIAKGEALGWSIVLKPQVSRLYHQHSIQAFEVTYAQTRENLAKQMARCENVYPVLLQEYYPGEGHGVELLMHEGRPLAAFQRKRLREVPLNDGTSALHEAVSLDPQLYDRSGMDFPAHLAEIYLEGPLAADSAPCQAYQVGVRTRDLELDILWIAAVLNGKQRYPFLQIPKRQQAVRAIFELFHPAYKFDILSWDDPLPGLAEIAKISHKLYSKAKQEH